jgi:hypothetical protein
MRDNEQYIGAPITLQAETRVEAMRRVFGPYPRRVDDAPSAESIERARAAGAKEAAEATAATGVDYSAAYERMCRLLAGM